MRCPDRILGLETIANARTINSKRECNIDIIKRMHCDCDNLIKKVYSMKFIDGMDYVGTVLVGITIPFLVDLGKGDWGYVFVFWVILSFLVAVSVAVVYFCHFKDNVYFEHDARE